MKKKNLTDQEFVKILNDLFGCGDAWLKNKGSQDISILEVNDIITCSFYWAKSPEGSDYWAEVTVLLRELIKGGAI